MAPLPAQWRGFSTDLRALRSIAVLPTPLQAASPLRQQYLKEAAGFAETAKARPLTAEEQADWGAILIRLGQIEQALHVLREAQRVHPQHFQVLANLATAWHHLGDLRQAEEHLAQAIPIAPAAFKRAEQYHQKLVQLRRRLRQSPQVAEESLRNQKWDDLFGVRYIGKSGRFEPGQLAFEERKKLPSDAVAIIQQLTLWFPNDPLLLWQLAELANAHGDLKIAAELYESCVGQFALSSPTVRMHRASVRAALNDDALIVSGETAKLEHETHAGRITFNSRRPLVPKPFDSDLPTINTEGVNPVPWALLLETSIDRHFRPSFHDYLKNLHGFRVSITGFIQPITDEIDMPSFMLIEYPTGCWYCEMPEITGIAFVELPEGKRLTYSRNMQKVTGILILNSGDPENFLYTLKEAEVVAPD